MNPRYFSLTPYKRPETVSDRCERDVERHELVAAAAKHSEQRGDLIRVQLAHMNQQDLRKFVADDLDAAPSEERDHGLHIGHVDLAHSLAVFGSR